MTAECVLAAVLLVLPAEPRETCSVIGPSGYAVTVSMPAALEEVLRADLVAFAIDAEIHDEVCAVDFVAFRERIKCMKDAPLAGELSRFPDDDHVKESLHANRKYRSYLESRQSIDAFHAEELACAISKCDQLHLVWSTLREARMSGNVVDRRLSLSTLRGMIGGKAFYSGVMPRSVP